MRIRAGWAFASGALGAVVLAVLLVAAQALGITDLNLLLLTGTLVGVPPGSASWVVGFVVHLLAGGVIGLLYAAIFEAWRHADWRRGAAVGVPHAFLGGVLLGFLPLVHPALTEYPELRAPGFLGVNFGWQTVVTFIVLHVAYGAVVGGIYGTRRPARSPADEGAEGRAGAAHRGRA
jgi:hypothetical protein